MKNHKLCFNDMASFMLKFHPWLYKDGKKAILYNHLIFNNHEMINREWGEIPHLFENLLILYKIWQKFANCSQDPTPPFYDISWALYLKIFRSTPDDYTMVYISSDGNKIIYFRKISFVTQHFYWCYYISTIWC